MGAEAVIDKIMLKAAAEAESILQEGKAAADKKAAETAAEAAEKKNAILAEGKAEADAIVYREKLKSELDARKNTLAEKRNLIDKVFDEVKNKLISLPDNEKTAIYDKFVASFGMKGNIKLYASDDMKNFCESRAATWNATYAGSISGKDKILLCGDTCDADLSMDSIIEDLRDKYESEVSSILFGE